MTARYLCSHIVHIRREDPNLNPEPAVLEQIDEQTAVIGSETDYPVEVPIVIEAQNLAAPAQVVVTRERETDFEIIAQFSQGYRWTREAWTPNHLLEVTPRRKAKGASGR